VGGKTSGLRSVDSKVALSTWANEFKGENPMTEQTLKVPEVHCDHCVSSIEGAVGNLDGVTEVRVDLNAKAVSVVFDESSVRLDKIVETIEGQGYDVGEGDGLMQIGKRPD
jgi:copper chaperone